MMIDRNGFVGNGAIRKYWLAQDFIRSIAMTKLTGVEYVGGDIHRQIVRWDNGATVFVNRGEKDWTVAGKILPMYGYYAVNGKIESSIERINGSIVERSASGKGTSYFNGRGFTSDGALAIRPSVKSIEVVAPRKFKMPIHWQATESAPKDLSIFVHFKSDKAQRRDKIAFQADHNPQDRDRLVEGRGRDAGRPNAGSPGRYPGGCLFRRGGNVGPDGQSAISAGGQG